jgi:MFS family permease
VIRQAGAVKGRAGAIALVFVANGFGGPSFLARLPERQRELGLSEGRLGLVVAGMGLGALVASAVAGRLVERSGSRSVVAGSAVALGLCQWTVGAAPGALALFLALMVVGAADAVMDISMNANGAVFERGSGRSVMHRLHAAWSLGALSAAGVASVAAGLDVPLSVHLGAVGAAIVVVGLMARRTLEPGALAMVDITQAVGATGAAGDAGAAGAAGAAGDAAAAPVGEGRRRPGRWVHGIGLLAALSIGGAMLEGPPADWGAVRIEQFGVPSWVPALGFAAFMAGMLAARAVGDHLTDRHGDAAVLRVGTALAAAGFVLGAVVAHPVTFMIGLAMAGFGTSSLFPLAFSAASRTPGVAPGVGAAVVSLTARVGFLVEPVLVGSLAELIDLRWSFLLVAGMALALSIAAPRIVPPAGARRAAAVVGGG